MSDREQIARYAKVTQTLDIKARTTKGFIEIANEFYARPAYRVDTKIRNLMDAHQDIESYHLVIDMYIIVTYMSAENLLEFLNAHSDEQIKVFDLLEVKK